MSLINIHTHVFTQRNAPENFLGLFLPRRIADFVEHATNTTAGVMVFSRILRLRGEVGKRYANFLKVGKSKTQREIFENLMQQYSQDEMRFVVLSMYMEEMGAGRSLSGYMGQLEELIQLKRMYPEQLLIFLGIDPRMRSSGQEILSFVEKAFSQEVQSGGKSYRPFVGLKIYPSTGFYAFDEKLFPVLDWAARNEVPIMSHCYYRGGVYNSDKNAILSSLNAYLSYDVNTTYSMYCKSNKLNEPLYKNDAHLGKRLLGVSRMTNNKRTCSYFIEPASYEPVLAYFQQRNTPLKLCLAHYGGVEQIKLGHSKKGKIVSGGNRVYTKDQSWYLQIKDMMSRFDSLYTDISYSLFDDQLHEFFLEDAESSIFGDRILFGTDYYMTEQDKSEKELYSDFRSKAIIRKDEKAAPEGNLWLKMAKSSPEKFLKSKFYP